jgi:hypothetical protein
MMRVAINDMRCATRCAWPSGVGSAYDFLRGLNQDTLSDQETTARQFCARDIKYYYNKTTNIIGELQTTRRSSSCFAKDSERQIIEATTTDQWHAVAIPPKACTMSG